MGKPITNITIVGGGTAGWITAFYLIHRYKRRKEIIGQDVSITLIESPDVAIIGVGEATVPTLKGTLREGGISEAEFFARADATFKLGIWFKGWNRKENGAPIGFLHPFTGGLSVDGMNPGYSFKKHGLSARPEFDDQDFVRVISHAREAMERMCGPRALNDPEYSGALQYAYHLDAAKFSEFLAEVCVARGVAHVRDNVEHVRLDERGFISSLQLRERGDWPVELVVDCTGFKALLISGALKEPFESFSDYLLNDRAIPIQIKHRDPARLEPVTTSTALEAGWSWNIPLRSRIGAGYVFCSAFKSDDDAKKEFLDHLGPVAQGMDPHVIKMRVGRMRRSWVKNCVAVGLASGFLEPLESTAIMTIELQARWLLNVMPSTDFEEPLIREYNSLCESLYGEVRDFLGIHFTQNNRDDTPFWRACRRDAKKSDSLRAQLDLWKCMLPGPLDLRDKRVFSNWSVLCLLMGKDFYKNPPVGVLEVVSSLKWQKYCHEVWRRKQAVLDGIADHRALVESIAGSSVAGRSLRDAYDPAAAPKLGLGILTVDPQPIMSQLN